jgi:hypothetical protein
MKTANELLVTIILSEFIQFEFRHFVMYNQKGCFAHTNHLWDPLKVVVVQKTTGY